MGFEGAPTTPSPQYRGLFDPVHPCRQQPTRHCPAVYGEVCGDRPCARFEADEEDPAVVAAWMAEIGRTGDLR